MDDSKYITIFSQKLAGYLMYKGFVLMGWRKNKDNSGKNVFDFKNSEELRSAISDYKQM